MKKYEKTTSYILSNITARSCICMNEVCSSVFYASGFPVRRWVLSTQRFWEDIIWQRSLKGLMNVHNMDHKRSAICVVHEFTLHKVWSKLSFGFIEEVLQNCTQVDFNYPKLVIFVLLELTAVVKRRLLLMMLLLLMLTSGLFRFPCFVRFFVLSLFISLAWHGSQ